MKKILILLLLLIPCSVKAFGSNAECAILMDMDSNRIMYADDIHKVRSIASITKIMTAVLAIESGKLNDIVTVGDEIKDAYGSAIYIKEGETLTLNDLVYGLMLRSGNDAALSIAKYVSGDVKSFVKLMNEKTIEIGMKNTTFNNPSGLDNDKGNYSTAYDMAILTSYAMKNEIYQEVVKTKEYKLKTNMNTYIWYNKNKLLTLYKYATGGKTGYTEVAKRTLVTTASKDNLNLVAVTLNDGDDFNDHRKLFDEGFTTYIKYRILEQGNITIYDDKYYDDYYFYIKDSFYYPLEESETKSIVLKFELEKKTNAKDNEKVGTVIIKLGDENLYQTDVFVKTKKVHQNLFQKIGKWFKNLW